MKKIMSFLLAVTASFALFTACGKGGDDSASVDAPDTSALESAFASAEEDLKAVSDKVVSYVNEDKLDQALAEAQKLASNASLTEEQKKAVSDFVASVQKQLSAKLEAAGEEMEDAAEDMKKSAEDAKEKMGF